MNDDSKTVLGMAVLKILKPLLRVLIKNNITVHGFSDLARRAYVETAHEHFSIPGKKLTSARVAVLTGLNRKEVYRIEKHLGEEKNLSRSAPNRAMRVVNGWLQDEEFLTKKNTPRVLPLYGDKRCFVTLVGRYGGDISHGAVLDELLRVGVVSRNDHDQIRLEAPGYIPHKNEVEKISVMATCAADLLGTAVHNIEFGDVDPLFQRQVVYPSVSDETAHRFRTESAEISAEYIQKLNRLLAKLHKESTNKLGTHRVGLGIYHFDSQTHTTTRKEIDKDD